MTFWNWKIKIKYNAYYKSNRIKQISLLRFGWCTRPLAHYCKFFSGNVQIIGRRLDVFINAFENVRHSFNWQQCEHFTLKSYVYYVLSDERRCLLEKKLDLVFALKTKLMLLFRKMRTNLRVGTCLNFEKNFIINFHYFE